MKQKFIHFLLTALLPLMAFSQPNLVDFKMYGTVYNTNKEPVAEWPVTIQGDNKAIWTLKTDKNGFYKQLVSVPEKPTTVFEITVIDPCSRAPIVQKMESKAGSDFRDFIICAINSGNPCRVYFKFSQIKGSQAVEFFAQPEIKGTTYKWDFGDGEVGEGFQTTHKYAKEGNYVVVLHVESPTCIGDYKSEVKVETVVTNPPKPPKVNVEAHCCGTIQIQSAPSTTNISSNTFKFTARGDYKIGEVTWDFGDGEKGTGIEVVHTYAKPGKYLVTATIAGEFCKVEINNWLHVSDVVTPNPCPLDFNFKFSGLEAFFASNFTVKPDKFEWSFGDGTTSTDLNPSHKYAKEGEYKVILRAVFNGVECSIEKIIKVSTGVTPSVCPFDFQFKSSGLEAQFQSTFKEKPEKFIWYFGDGGSSSDANPGHQYPKAGEYRVVLVAVFNGKECRIEKIIKISNGVNPNPVSIEIVEVAPNPVIDDAIVVIKSDQKVQVTLVVADVNGVSMKKQLVDLEAGLNKVQVITKDLRPGTYLVYLYYNGAIVAKGKFQRL